MAFYKMLSQVIVLFLLMGIGYVLSVTRKIDTKGSNQMTFLLCYIVSPSIIFYAFLIKFQPDKFINLLIVAAAAAFIHIFNIIAGKIIFNKRLIKNEDRKIVAQFASVYSNCGFMGFPLLQAFAGNPGLFYGSAYNGIFGLFSWTHGMLLYSGKVNRKSIAKALINPNVLAVIAGALFFRFSISLPGPLYTAVKYISELNTPLSMIVIGTTITQIPLKQLFNDRLAWVVVLVRNIILPFAMLFILHAAGLKGILLLCCMIPAACPAAGVTVLFAKLTGRDVVFPGKVMTLSTISSLLTLPFVITAINSLKF
ncbi:MAG TPA: AEC family transporter [Ruminiclostridium sp.]|nr:AEC family transporter [Ruminiclostridium sp.]